MAFSQYLNINNFYFLLAPSLRSKEDKIVGFVPGVIEVKFHYFLQAIFKVVS